MDGRRIKAATYSFSKWAWVGAASDLRILRASIGRHREEASLQATDDELVARVVGDLTLATGQPIEPLDAHVQRWGGALPQYAVGHLDRVVRIQRAVADVPGLALCGAAYDGVGIPAVIGSARRGHRVAARGRMRAWPSRRRSRRTPRGRAQLNDSVRYTMWSVFRLDRPLGPDVDRAAEAAEVDELLEKLAPTTWSCAGRTTCQGSARTPT